MIAKRRIIISANAVISQGGQGLNLHHMLEGARTAFDVTLFARAGSPAVNTQTVPDSSTSKLIARFPLLRRLRDLQTFFSDTHFDRYVASRLTTADVFQGVTGQCLESLRAAKRIGCRAVLDVVTLHVEDFIAGQERECAKFRVRPSIHPEERKRILHEYQEAEVIRVMSERARQTFLERGFAQERIFTVPPPINLAEFPEAKFDEPKFRVSFVGLIEPWKGFHYLIEAFNALNLRDSELVLWGGSGSRAISRYLREQTAHNPQIVVRPIEVRRCYGEVYAKSSVLAHPSVADGFGYVIAEAMASGIPVIVTDKTGAADWVIDGHNGYIVPVGDVEALRDRLAHLAANPALLRRMGRAARETAGKLTFERFRTRLLACLESRSVPGDSITDNVTAEAAANG